MGKTKTENENEKQEAGGREASAVSAVNVSLEMGQSYLEASASSGVPFKWNKKKLQVAFLLSLGKYNNSDISKALKIAPQTIATWKKIPAFIQKVNEFILTTGLSDKVRRVSGQRVILEKIENILLEKLSSSAEARFIKPTPLLSKYYQGIQELRKDTEATAGVAGVGRSGGRSINLIAIINNMQSGNKQELKNKLKQAVIEAVKRKRGVLGVSDENIIEAVASSAGVQSEAGQGKQGSGQALNNIKNEAGKVATAGVEAPASNEAINFDDIQEATEAVATAGVPIKEAGKVSGQSLGASNEAGQL